MEDAAKKEKKNNPFSRVTAGPSRRENMGEEKERNRRNQISKDGSRKEKMKIQKKR